jgi:hypothetical protein
MEIERKRLAALGVWPQGRLDWSHPSRTPEKALIVDQKRKSQDFVIFLIIFLF